MTGNLNQVARDLVRTFRAAVPIWMRGNYAWDHAETDRLVNALKALDAFDVATFGMVDADELPPEVHAKICNAICRIDASACGMSLYGVCDCDAPFIAADVLKIALGRTPSNFTANLFG